MEEKKRRISSRERLSVEVVMMTRKEINCTISAYHRIWGKLTHLIKSLVGRMCPHATSLARPYRSSNLVIETLKVPVIRNLSRPT